MKRKASTSKANPLRQPPPPLLTPEQVFDLLGLSPAERKRVDDLAKQVSGRATTSARVVRRTVSARRPAARLGRGR